MTKFTENMIVKGKYAGEFVVMAHGPKAGFNQDGENQYYLKVHEDGKLYPGHILLPESALEYIN